MDGQRRNFLFGGMFAGLAAWLPFGMARKAKANNVIERGDSRWLGECMAIPAHARLLIKWDMNFASGLPSIVGMGFAMIPYDQFVKHYRCDEPDHLKRALTHVDRLMAAEPDAVCLCDLHRDLRYAWKFAEADRVEAHWPNNNHYLIHTRYPGDPLSGVVSVQFGT